MGNDLVSVLHKFIVANNENPLLKGMQYTGMVSDGDAPFCFMQNIIYHLADTLVERAVPEKNACIKEKYHVLRNRSDVMCILGEAWRVMHVISRIFRSPGYAWKITPSKLLLCNNNLFINAEKEALDYLAFIICHIAKIHEITFYDEQLIFTAWTQVRKRIIDLYDDFPGKLLDLPPLLTPGLRDIMSLSDINIWTDEKYLYIEPMSSTARNRALCTSMSRSFLFCYEGTRYRMSEEALLWVKCTGKILISHLPVYAE